MKRGSEMPFVSCFMGIGVKCETRADFVKRASNENHDFLGCACKAMPYMPVAPNNLDYGRSF